MGPCPSRAGGGGSGAGPTNVSQPTRGARASRNWLSEAEGTLAAAPLAARASEARNVIRTPNSQQLPIPQSIGSRGVKSQQSPSSVPLHVGLGNQPAPSRDAAGEPQWLQYLSSKFEDGGPSPDRASASTASVHVKGTRGMRAAAKASAASDSAQHEMPGGSQATAKLQTEDYFRMLKEAPTSTASTIGGFSRGRRTAEGRDPIQSRPIGIGSSSALLCQPPPEQRTPLQALARELATYGQNADEGVDGEASFDVLNVSNFGIRSRGSRMWQDDTWIDSWAADRDLSEIVYWSDDDAHHVNARLLPSGMVSRASAHPLGRLTQEIISGVAVRGYVMQDLSVELDRKVAQILLQLTRLGDTRRQLFHGARRPLVLGLREVQRAVNRSHAACVVVSPDIEGAASGAPSGAEIRVREILAAAYEREIPVIFALSRARIGQALAKTLPLQISVVAMSDVRGVRAALDEALELAQQLRSDWLTRVSR